MFLIWGTSLEKHYGTAFYASINLALCVISNLLTVGINFLVAYTFPREVFGFKAGGGPASLSECGVGYSNILFGIMMLESLMGGETH